MLIVINLLCKISILFLYVLVLYCVNKLKEQLNTFSRNIHTW